MQHFNLKPAAILDHTLSWIPNAEDEAAWRDIFSQKEAKLLLMLNTILKPTLVLTANGRIYAINNEAQRILATSAENCEGKQFGDVLNCKYASLPKGCGQTMHCPECDVFHLVTLTQDANVSFYWTHAFLHRSTGDDKPVAMRLSTQPIIDYTLLRIDEVN